MIMPKQAKEIPQNTVKEIASVPTKKVLTVEEINKVHEKIESGTGNVNTAIDYYKSKNYAFYEAIFTEPRTSYLESIVNSINTEEELTTAITNLEQKGYIISEKIISIIQNLLDKK
jgi:hypothetical protein